MITSWFELISVRPLCPLCLRGEFSFAIYLPDTENTEVAQRKLKTRTNLLQDEWFGFLQPLMASAVSANKHLILSVGLVNGLR
jgi:hypothetical protein